MDLAEIRARLGDAALYVVSADGIPEAQTEMLCRAIDGGAGIVQLRNKTAEKGSLLDTARKIAAYARQKAVIFVVNDHVDLAVAAGADGVHLGQDDLPIAAARRISPDLLVGRSTHDLAQAADAEVEGADYVAVGPVFATATKPGRPAVGLELVSDAARRLHGPWFAIGGIGPTTIDAVLNAGARRVAVVRAVCAAPDPARAAAGLVARVRSLAVAPR